MGKGVDAHPPLHPDIVPMRPTSVISLILALLFAAFTYFQFNDPDAVPWVILYGAVAVVFGFAAADRHFLPVTAGLGVICLAWSLYHLPAIFEYASNSDGVGLSEGMSYAYPYIERSREFGGLFLAFLALLWLFFQQRKPVED
ncbi:MAG: hypothetical protein D6722_14090 [Bacteroidetes bacterium]|nr:MAG: hypothetical protein D6722_14090 [Bacteroidota bacterium]